MGWVILGMDHFGSYSIFGSVRLWVGLLWVFGSKPIVFISNVGSGTDLGCSVRVSGVGSILPGLAPTTYKYMSPHLVSPLHSGCSLALHYTPQSHGCTVAPQ